MHCILSVTFLDCLAWLSFALATLWKSKSLKFLILKHARHGCVASVTFIVEFCLLDDRLFVYIIYITTLDKMQDMLLVTSPSEYNCDSSSWGTLKYMADVVEVEVWFVCVCPWQSLTQLVLCICCLWTGSSAIVVLERCHEHADFSLSRHKTLTHCMTRQHQLPLTQLPLTRGLLCLAFTVTSPLSTANCHFVCYLYSKLTRLNVGLSTVIMHQWIQYFHVCDCMCVQSSYSDDQLSSD